MLILRQQHSYLTMKHYWAQINKPPSQLNHMKGGQGAFDTWVVYVLLLQIDMK